MNVVMYRNVSWSRSEGSVIAQPHRHKGTGSIADRVLVPLTAHDYFFSRRVSIFLGRLQMTTYVEIFSPQFIFFSCYFLYSFNGRCYVP